MYHAVIGNSFDKHVSGTDGDKSLIHVRDIKDRYLKSNIDPSKYINEANVNQLEKLQSVQFIKLTQYIWKIFQLLWQIFCVRVLEKFT